MMWIYSSFINIFPNRMLAICNIFLLYIWTTCRTCRGMIQHCYNYGNLHISKCPWVAEPFIGVVHRVLKYAAGMAMLWGLPTWDLPPQTEPVVPQKQAIYQPTCRQAAAYPPITLSHQALTQDPHLTQCSLLASRSLVSHPVSMPCRADASTLMY